MKITDGQVKELDEQAKEFQEKCKDVILVRDCKCEVCNQTSLRVLAIAANILLVSSEREQSKSDGVLILTVAEIRDLARFAGFVLTEDWKLDAIDDETEIAVMACPEGGLLDPEAAKVSRYAHVACLHDRPEEGSHGLGAELPSPKPDMSNEGKGRECHNSVCPHWRTGNECLFDGSCKGEAK